MEHDAHYWDDRYAEAGGDKHEHAISDGPDPTVVEVVSALAPGRALDVAAGRGRHALWLAAQGWQVTAVDWSHVGLDLGRAHQPPEAVPIEWVTADVSTWDPEHAAYDLVLCAFVHLDLAIYARIRRWLGPTGHLVVVGHALRNLTDGHGGPTNPAYLHTVDQLRTVADGLTIERLEELERPTPAGPQIDVALVASAG
ncbi:MAG: class I SAM-dependent methyltransferase [Actinomycetales bacterium]